MTKLWDETGAVGTAVAPELGICVLDDRGECGVLFDC